MQRLPGADAMFLYMETPDVHLHIGFAGVFDPSTMPGPYSFRAMLDRFPERLHIFPPFRQRLASVPLQIHHPVWVDDPSFDLEYHVRRACLPSPGGLHQLAEFAGDVMSRPLDRSRPLWEMWFVEGLEHGHIALVAKAHHAIVDGVGGADMMVSLLDLEPDPAPIEPVPWEPETPPSGLALAAGAARELVGQPTRVARAARRLAGDVGRAAHLVRSDEGGSLSVGGPRTCLNQTVGPHRRAAFVSFPLDEARAVKQALGGTVNDVVLAACSGALREYLTTRGEELSETLTASVPVSVRTQEHAGSLGNQLAGVIVPLASDLDDPQQRLGAITAATAQAKEMQSAVAARVMTEWSEFATPAVASRAFRLITRTGLLNRVGPLYNVSISNVPGPTFPLYLGGARMVSMNPMGPVMDGNALSITVVSYMGTMFCGLVADREALPDLDRLAALIPEEFGVLHKAAGAAA